MNLSNLTFKIAGGLFFSIIYIAVSYLVSYLSVYWDWELGVGGVWFIIGYITYSTIFDEYPFVVNVLGVIINIGIILLLFLKLVEPQLWIYIVLNTIVCLNIIITCLHKR